MTRTDRRVVVTGMGILSPVGTGVDEYWAALTAGRSGIRTITAFDASAFDTHFAGEIPGFDPVAAGIPKKEARHMDRYTQLGVVAAAQAVRASGLLDRADLDKRRVGVYFGSGIGGIQTWEAQHRILIEKGPGRMSPFFIPMLIPNMCAGQISIEYGFQGPNSCAVTACATASHNIGGAYHVIQRGDADVMIAGGAEAAIAPMGIGGFCASRALSERNDAPEKASRPFDKDRDGFVMGEGGGALVLEELEHAKKRGATIVAEMAGFGMSGDAYHMTAPCPDGAGAVLAMQRCLDDGGILPGQVDYVNAHGTSTPAGDPQETLAIKMVLGDRAREIGISSTKSMIGHLLGAAGVVELIACIQSIQTGVLHPTINYETPDPSCDLDYVPNRAREAKVRLAISNSFGFGGHNATVAVRAFEG